MKRIAVFPGSFDPITQGHVSLVNRSASLFDEIIVAVGLNSEKKAMFPAETRIKWIKQVFSGLPNVRVQQYSGLTVDFCREVGAGFLLRGLRTSADFEFERSIGQVNKMLDHHIETVFLLAEARYTPVSSSIVRDVIRYKGDISFMVPPEIIEEIKLL